MTLHHRRGRSVLRLEHLEPREMPASVYTYTDMDGDKVRVSSSVGVLNNDNFSFATLGLGKRCIGLFLGLSSAGADIVFSASKVPGGDGLVNVGAILATGIDLGNVTINGDLVYISCGSGNPDHRALKSLNVRSMGRFADPVSDGVSSNIVGGLGALRVTGDLRGVYVHVTGGAAGTIRSVTIGGSVIGSSSYASGVTYCTGDMGPVKIGHDLVGGSGLSSGQVGSGAKTGSVTVGGSVVGGSGSYSGLVFGMTGIGPVRIGRDIVGGSAAQSGSVALLGTEGKITSVSVGSSLVVGGGELSGTVRAGIPFDLVGTAAVGNVTVGGSVLGGVGKHSGKVYSGGALGTVRIGRDLHGGTCRFSGEISAVGVTAAIAVGGSVVGGAAEESGTIHVGDVTGRIAIAGSLVGGYGNSSGALFAAGVGSVSIGGDLVGGSVTDRIDGLESSGAIGIMTTQSITIGGSIIAGSNNNSPNYFLSSAAITVGQVGAITVRGSIIGNVTQAVRIYVDGKLAGAAGFALGSLTVGGSIERAVIQAGSPVASLNARIGTVRVGGDWIASSLASGVNSIDGIYGNGDELIVFNDSQIAAIIIGGAIFGTIESGASYAFTAHEIGSFQVRGHAVPRTSAIDPAISFSPETGGNVRLVEL